MITDIKSKPYVIVLFGATGDLTSRKIIPALYNLFLDNWLPDQFVILGCSIDKLSDEEFRKKLFSAVNQFSRKGKAEGKKWTEFASHMFYQNADFNNSEEGIGK
jgi:glucose-6-phosphate 1-dehydrogenase